jgi:hypothetical protein
VLEVVDVAVAGSPSGFATVAPGGVLVAAAAVVVPAVVFAVAGVTVADTTFVVTFGAPAELVVGCVGVALAVKMAEAVPLGFAGTAVAGFATTTGTVLWAFGVRISLVASAVRSGATGGVGGRGEALAKFVRAFGAPI